MYSSRLPHYNYNYNFKVETDRLSTIRQVHRHAFDHKKSQFSLSSALRWTAPVTSRQRAQYDPLVAVSFSGLPMLSRQNIPTAFNDNRWLQKWLNGVFLVNQTAIRFLSGFGKPNITDVNDYLQIYEHFLDWFGEGNPRPDSFWRRDNATDPKLRVDDRWNDDDVFAQSRLVGYNPAQIERVTEGETVGANWRELYSKKLNPTFDWDAAVQYELPNMTVAEVGARFASGSKTFSQISTQFFKYFLSDTIIEKKKTSVYALVGNEAVPTVLSGSWLYIYIYTENFG